MTAMPTTHVPRPRRSSRAQILEIGPLLFVTLHFSRMMMEKQRTMIRLDLFDALRLCQAGLVLNELEVDSGRN